MKEDDQREILPELPLHNAHHGRNPNGRRSHPCPAFRIQRRHRNCSYNQSKKDPFIHVLWEETVLEMSVTAYQKVSSGLRGSQFPSQSWKKLRVHNCCHVKAYHVLIAAETETHHRSSDKNSWDTLGMESITTSLKPQESLSIVNALHTTVPALLGAIVRHKSH